jgi:hypothetical protein
LIGLLETSDNKKEYIFVAIDHYTIWLETAVQKDKGASRVKNCIELLVVLKHGISKKIYTDNGSELKNAYISELIEKYKLIWDYNFPGHSKR